ncbi:MFS transporter [Streptomyces sp. NPDC017993]|uniref:MFS transporter n=1 Tax=Streptomyces sp. NPDC017993 TaxID=3365027 RepID=UPI0037B1D6AC
MPKPRSLYRSLAPLRHRDYRLFFISYLISMLGDGVWLVALPWVAMELGGDSSELAMVVGAEAVGLISCVLVGGVLADRFPRKRVIGWSFVASFAALGMLTVVHIIGDLMVWQLVGAAFVLGASAAISGPASDAFTPDLVPEEDLHSANALESTVRSLTMRMVGPALGGVLISLLDSMSVIALNGVSFGVAALCVAVIRPGTSAGSVSEKEAEAEPTEPVPYRQALSYLFGERWLWVLIVWSGVVLLLQSGPRQVLLPFLISDRLGGDARDYGLLIAVTGIAAVVASVVLGARKPPKDYARWMLLAWTAGAAPLALMVFVPSFWLLLPMAAVYGFCSTVGNVYWSTLIQTVPSRVRGRVISIDWLGSLALVPLSAVIAGVGTGRAFMVTLFVLGGTLPVLFTLATLRWVDLSLLRPPGEAVEKSEEPAPAEREPQVAAPPAA